MIATVVEGHGEVAAVPILLRRIIDEIFGRHDVRCAKPYRLPRGRMRSTEMLKVSRLLTERADGRVLVVVDADDDCPVELADAIRTAMGPWSGSVAVAVREFEAWFLAGWDGLRSHPAVTPEARYDGDPEQPRDAKGRLQRVMKEPYRETLHQAAFARAMSLPGALQTRSFAHLVRCIQQLIDPGRGR